MWCRHIFCVMWPGQIIIIFFSDLCTTNTCTLLLFWTRLVIVSEGQSFLALDNTGRLEAEVKLKVNRGHVKDTEWTFSSAHQLCKPTDKDHYFKNQALFVPVGLLHGATLVPQIQKYYFWLSHQRFKSWPLTPLLCLSPHSLSAHLQSDYCEGRFMYFLLSGVVFVQRFFIKHQTWQLVCFLPLKPPMSK